MRSTRRAALLAVASAGIALASIALGAGCEEQGASPPASPAPLIRSGPPGARFPAASQDTSVPVRTRIVPSEHGPRLDVSGARGSGGGGSIRQPPGHVRGPTLTPDEAVLASRQASTRTGTREPCALAYAALLDVHRAYREATPRARGGPANRERFMARCQEKPTAEQWCLVPSYISSHVAECDRDAQTRYARAVERLSQGDLETAAEVAAAANATAAAAEEPAHVGPERLGPREVAPAGAEEPADDEPQAEPAGRPSPTPTPTPTPTPSSPTDQEPPCTTGDCG